MRRGFGQMDGAAQDLGERRSARRQWECAFILAGALTAASFAPLAVVMPIVSVTLTMGAILAVGLAWLSAEHRAAAAFTRWDQAGVLLFAGFVAALTGDSAETLQMMETLAGLPPHGRE